MENLASDPLLNPGAFIDPTEDSERRNTKARANTGPKSGVSGEVPDWLPEGWRLEYRVRTSGATSGHKDKYYFDPVSNRRFRSKNEVLSYLEGGYTGKRNTSSASSPSGSSKRKKAEPKVNLKNFDFNNVPEKVTWVFTDVDEGSWKPVVHEGVPETTKRLWDAAFTHLASKQNGSHPK